MPKKYLLYIHDSDQFDTLTGRGAKSGLINQLLDKHWTLGPQKKPVGPVNPVSHPTPDIAGKIPAKKVIKTPAQAKAAVAKDSFCEHGFAPGFCKKQKCKNAKRK